MKTSTSMEAMPSLQGIKAKHAFAFKDLRSYASDDEVTEARLSKFLAAETVHGLIENRRCLELHLAASTFIDELYDELSMLDRPECRRIFESAPVAAALSPMKTDDTKHTPGTIHLVCRNTETGREVSHQGFDPSDADRANRIMIARNRAEIRAGSNDRWGIETIEESAKATGQA